MCSFKFVCNVIRGKCAFCSQKLGASIRFVIKIEGMTEKLSLEKAIVQKVDDSWQKMVASKRFEYLNPRYFWKQNRAWKALLAVKVIDLRIALKKLLLRPASLLQALEYSQKAGLKD